MNELLESISELSIKGLIPIGLLFFCGLLLWAAGRRVMRVGFATIGLIAGGLLGATIGNKVNLGVAPWVVGASGAVVFVVIASLAYRLALAGAVGLLFATLAPLVVWTANERELIGFSTVATVQQEALAQAKPQVELDLAVDPEAIQQKIDWVRDTVDQILASDTAETLFVSTGEDDANADDPQVSTPLRAAWRLASKGWNGAEASFQGLLVAACAFGAMLGFVVGTGAPVFSAIIVSSLGGSFLILSTGWVMGAKTSLAHGLLDNLTPTNWTLLWLITSVLGLGIQWIFRPKHADKSAS